MMGAADITVPKDVGLEGCDDELEDESAGPLSGLYDGAGGQTCGGAAFFMERSGMFLRWESQHEIRDQGKRGWRGVRNMEEATIRTDHMRTTKPSHELPHLKTVDQLLFESHLMLPHKVLVFWSRNRVFDVRRPQSLHCDLAKLVHHSNG